MRVVLTVANIKTNSQKRSNDISTRFYIKKFDLHNHFRKKGEIGKKLENFEMLDYQDLATQK